MKYIILSFLFLTAVGVKAEETPTTNNTAKKTEETLENVVKTAATAAGHPEIAAAVEVAKNVKDLVHYESKRSLSKEYERFGFKQINSLMSSASGSVREENLIKLIEYWMTNIYDKFLPAKTNEIIAKSMGELALSVIDDSYGAQQFEISYNTGNGNIYMIIIHFSTHPTRPNILRWQRHLLTATFQPYPGYIIETYSHCNLIRCKSRDKPIWMPAAAKPEHIQAIIALNVAMFNAFTSERPDLISFTSTPKSIDAPI